MVKKLTLLSVMFLFVVNTAFAKTPMNYDIYGVQPDVEANIKARLAAMDNNSVPKLYRQSLVEIKKAMQPYGNFKPTIKSRLIRIKGSWHAIYNINPGPQLLLNQVTVKIEGPGAGTPRLHRYLSKHTPKVGDPFDVPTYEKFKTRLFQIAKNAGYLKAYFINKILINLSRYQSKMNVKLITGEQYYFGDINFKTFPYSKNFLRRSIAAIKPGDVFSSAKLLKQQQRMENSYYYDQAIFKIKLDDIKNRRVPVDAYFYPPSPRSYRAGIGYGTFTGMRISGGMSLRHLGSEGQHLETDARISKVLTSISSVYYIPGNDPLTEEWSLGAYAKRFDPNAGVSESLTVTGGYSKEFNRWKTAISINYLIDKFVIYSKRPWQTTHLAYFAWTNSYIYADNISNPTNGFSANLILQASPRGLSQTHFISMQTRLKAVLSPFSFNRFVLIAGGGAIDVHDLNRFPLSMRYFAGGINSIRGFAISSIGPGKYLITGSAEYQQRIKGDLFAAVFYDAGTATNHFIGKLNRGVGVGAVYDTKIGPIKLYLARAVSKATRPYSIEFSMGPEFS